MGSESVNFITTNVIEPALKSQPLGQAYKNKVKNSKTLLKNFKRTGDLYLYLQRFKTGHGTGNDALYHELKRLGLNTFEDIITSFEEKFKDELNDFTVLSDFVVGEMYSSHDIAIFAKTYNVQQGICLIGKGQTYQAIFAKATLSDGMYPNEWLVPGKELKYYMFAPKNNYDENYKYNKAIIKSGKTPIYVFIKKKNHYRLEGVFKYIEYVAEQNGSKWFKLKKADTLAEGKAITEEEHRRELDRQVKESKQLSKEERKKRLKGAEKKPKKIKTASTQYVRNPDVIVEVLDRAKGICELCKNSAPFIRRADNTPYLEIHHKMQLSEGGEDSVDNAVAACPNCHRKAHFG